ncbi:MAG: hypothetical protein R2844_02855 [Caldilineales bacterium]
MRSIVRRPWLWVIVAVALLGAAALIARMGAGTTPNSEAAAPPLAVVAANVPASAPEPVTAVQATPSPEQPEAEAEALADVPSSDNCIACHTNQAVLQQLAEEPEEVVSELAAGEG